MRGNAGNTGRKFSKSHSEKISESLKKFHKDNPDVAKKRGQALKGRIPWNKGKSWSKEVKDKMSKSNKEFLNNHPDDIRLKKGKNSIRGGAKHTKEALKKMSIAVTKAIQEGRMDNSLPKRFIRGKYYSKKNGCYFHYRSSYELHAYQLLDNMKMVKSYEVECVTIPYFNGYDNVSKYTPDILVTYMTGDKELIEVKPLRFVDDLINVRKFKAAKKYCGKRDMRFSVWTEDQVFKYKLNKYPVNEDFCEVERTPVILN